MITQSDDFEVRLNNPELNPSLHSEEHPFCYDMSCPCHENPENIAQLHSFVQEGLASPQDADNIFNRRTL